MRKKLTTLSIIILILSTSIFCFMPLRHSAFAEETANGDDPIVEYNAQYYMSLFDKELKNRNLQGLADENTKSAIRNMFNPAVYTVTEKTSVANNTENSYNLYNLIVKRNDYDTTKEDILICVNMDNFYNRKLESGLNYLVDGSGAYSGSVGLTTAILMAKKAETMTFSYNIVFLLFSGNETLAQTTDFAYSSSYGTSKYLSAADNLDRISLVVDISTPLGGQYNYIYTGETDKVLYDEAMKFMSSNNFEYKKQPKNKKVLTYGDTQSKFCIRHAGMTSISLPFMEQNIQTMTFLSLNWNDSYSVYEFAGQKNLYNTNIDTLASLLERSPNLYSDIDKLSTNILSMFTNEEVKGAIATAKGQSEFVPLSNYNTFRIISFIIIGAAVLLMIVLLVYFKKHNNTNTGRPTEFDDTPKQKTPDVAEKKPDVFQF